MKPTKEYMAALAAEQSILFTEFFQHVAGIKSMTDEEKAAWTKRRDDVAVKVREAREQS